jgi:hypothetical protein
MFYNMSQQEIMIESKSTESEKTVRKKPDPKSFVQFRISADREYPKLLQLAQETHRNGMIKAPTVSAFAKASLMTMANFAIKVEQENERIREEENCKQSPDLVR